MADMCILRGAMASKAKSATALVDLKLLQLFDVLYTTDARIVCAKCYAVEDILATDKRAAQNIVKAAVGCAVLPGVGSRLQTPASMM